MKYSSFFLLVIFILSCSDQEKANTSSNNDSYISHTLFSGKSEDGQKKLTLKEIGYDSTSCYTQVFIDFGATGSGVYSTNGMNLGIRTYWKNNNTIVIETKKKYKAYQKWAQVQSFNDIIKVEYIEN